MITETLVLRNLTEMSAGQNRTERVDASGCQAINQRKAAQGWTFEDAKQLEVFNTSSIHHVLRYISIAIELSRTTSVVLLCCRC
jgi:hypothetical protein